MTDLVTYELSGRTARIRFDDGKVNVMSPAMLQELHDAFDRAAEARAVVVLSSGRPNLFTAGFDLKVIRGPTAGDLHTMLHLGAELALKILAFPQPVICVVEGSAFPINVNGSTEGVVVSFKDISDRKKAEAALRATEERFRSAHGFVEALVAMNDFRHA